MTHADIKVMRLAEVYKEGVGLGFSAVAICTIKPQTLYS